ncbi:hypothetical protein [Paludibaculum fermentans]|uniref:Uncharacterized protein n=1 Tax=Paludibaculum fermentans TaxID=1473598 RepID=A0A7S7NVI6_PALFE|nr:hypothetical protein [Paludibaculum fermentans]QOY90525.1 hypothetical protein IRI77_11415 [Paludibaculum fermentans]
MSRLATFFKGADNAFGVFFPERHVLAVFPNFADANAALAELRLAGQVEEDVIAATGEEVVQFAEEHLYQDGLWGLLMTELSRTIGTEAAYADRDLAAAKRGEAFVAVHCPTESRKVEAWKVLETRRPLVARYYTSSGIEHMVGEL